MESSHAQYKLYRVFLETFHNIGSNEKELNEFIRGLESVDVRDQGFIVDGTLWSVLGNVKMQRNVLEGFLNSNDIDYYQIDDYSYWVLGNKIKAVRTGDSYKVSVWDNSRTKNKILTLSNVSFDTLKQIILENK